jgi:prephenate dehydrogenase
MKYIGRSTTVGLIGFGSFGQFLAQKLQRHAKIMVYSTSGRANKWTQPLQKVCQADYLILAIPLEAYPAMLEKIKPLLKPETVIVDVCSVKVEPMAAINKALPDQPTVATHPLFGPESAAKSLEGHTLVVCPEVSASAPLQAIQKLAAKLQLEVVSMSAKEHDQEMAAVHGLTFFIAHALKDMDLHDQKLATPSFRKLLALAELEKHHSQDLFYTIQAGNPYTKTVRQKFLKEAQKLDQVIEKHS